MRGCPIIIYFSYIIIKLKRSNCCCLKKMLRTVRRLLYGIAISSNYANVEKTRDLEERILEKKPTGRLAASNNIKPLSAMFTTDTVTVDGVADAAYAKAEKSVIGHVKDGVIAADYSGETSTSGTVQAVWDGWTLYLFVDVTDNTPAYNSTYASKNKAEAIGDGDTYDWALWNAGDRENWHKAGMYNNGDAVEFSIDFWNDKVPKFQDDDGLFSITRDGCLTYYAEGMVKNHSSAYAQTENREYNNRVKAWAAREKEDGSGYCVELALALYAWDWEYDENGCLMAYEYRIGNGSRYGVDIMIGDSLTDDSSRGARVYWSHNDNSLPFSSRDFNADWGEITLTGWLGEDFAYDDWNLTNAIRFTESASLQKGVWSGETQRELDKALENAKATAGSLKPAKGALKKTIGWLDQAICDEAAKRLIKAVNALRWADTKYPDPLELKACFTLPNVYEFFDGTAVQSAGDWAARRREILDLAQFYEYGYKPAPPDCLTVDSAVLTQESVFSWITGKNEDISYYKITVTVTYGDASASTFFKLELPAQEQIADSGHTGARPVMLSFDAAVTDYLEAGYAVLTIPASDITDDRNDPWSGRSGFMRHFFPYDRSSVKEISNEMAAAWECSVAIDTLEKLVADKAEIGEYGTADRLLDTGKLAVTGFSICGKYAFVSAVFDERISVCVPGAAGCTGPSVYRYVLREGGLVWSWGVSTGSEVLADTIRHNPGRTIELCRRFLTPGRFYKLFDGAGNGAHGYGERLPYDHEELVASLAPRAIVLQSTIDDYADQSVGDALSLTLAKTIYHWLGYDQDRLVMHNFRDGTDHGSAYHGEDSAQRQRTIEYMNWYFYGAPISEATLRHLQTDPFYADVIDGEDGYTRNFGGLTAMAPWLD